MSKVLWCIRKLCFNSEYRVSDETQRLFANPKAAAFC